MYDFIFLLLIDVTITQGFFGANSRLKSHMSRRTSSKSFREADKGGYPYVYVNSDHQQRVSSITDKEGSLTKYMTLPVEQYVCLDMPLQAQLKRIQGSEFLLTVPAIKFFDTEVNPIVKATVTVTDSAVVIESTDVKITGSPLVDSLNGCFDMQIVVQLSWVDRPSSAFIRSQSDIKMWVNPPPPFNMVPREVTENTGNLAMKIALDQLEIAFLQSLGKDFERWACSDSYRQQRVAMMKEMNGFPSSELAAHRVHGLSIRAFILPGLFIGSGVTFVVLFICHDISLLHREPLLTVSI
eukprot:gnl/MRDRNA2_/MRDRNA2_66125_c0_seq2.p1 gnl/MRDRNA2_/MRDRNA2_66125_c0~~gnl/MRDRNA2_/MRDRNA2_66125_c0_seq2.p1  ORF type:complete len:318 (-),score=43.55 gnl/MRDRNA2_/MRDRNA2_66125_c0_seq2:261-1151(-)